jgi:hypothetical protein
MAIKTALLDKRGRDETSRFHTHPSQAQHALFHTQKKAQGLFHNQCEMLIDD